MTNRRNICIVFFHVVCAILCDVRLTSQCSVYFECSPSGGILEWDTVMGQACHTAQHHWSRPGDSQGRPHICHQLFKQQLNRNCARGQAFQKNYRTVLGSQLWNACKARVSIANWHKHEKRNKLYSASHHSRKPTFPDRDLADAWGLWGLDESLLAAGNGVASTFERVISVPSQPGDPVFYSNSSSLTPERYVVCFQ